VGGQRPGQRGPRTGPGHIARGRGGAPAGPLRRYLHRREKRASGTELPSGGAPKVAIASSVFGIVGVRQTRRRTIDRQQTQAMPQPGGEVAFEAFQQWSAEGQQGVGIELHARVAEGRRGDPIGQRLVGSTPKKRSSSSPILPLRSFNRMDTR